MNDDTPLSRVKAAIRAMTPEQREDHRRRQGRAAQRRYHDKMTPEQRKARNRAMYESRLKTLALMWAHLNERVGKQCFICGTTENLTYHHPNGRNWTIHGKGPEKRYQLYFEDWKAGNLVRCCQRHNTSIGDPRKPQRMWAVLASLEPDYQI